MRKIFCHMLASAVAFTSCILPSATTIAIKCPDVDFIFARGSGQKLRDTEYQAFESSLKSELAGSDLIYRFYELGASPHGGYQYPAIEANFTASLGAIINADTSKINQSALQGSSELVQYIKEVTQGCPDTKFAIGGYSQGSLAVMNALDFIDSNKIIYIANFGDPKLYLPEGEGLNPQACLGKNLSEYRVFVPNCKTHSGVLSARKPYHPKNYFGKIGLWCNNKDLFCGGGLKLSNPIEPHTVYASGGHIASAATIIRQKLEKHFSEIKSASIQVGKPSNNLHDTVFLLDTTASMSSTIQKAKQNILSLAQKTLSSTGGRIALYTYKDLDDNYRATRHLDFGATYTELENELNQITVSGGGDENESVLSAVMTVLNNQSWRFGANKSIVIVTDAGFHNPDRDGTTLWQVIDRTLEIDPVNLYIYTNDNISPLYTEISQKTSGGVFDATDPLSTDTISERPAAILPLPEYIGNVGDEFVFAATISGEVIKYEWDLDFDGVFETTSAAPTIKHIYNNPGSGFMQLRITDHLNRISTASAKVSILDSAEPIPEFKNLNYVTSKDSLNISYTKTGILGSIIAIDDMVLGFTEEADFALNNLSTDAIVTLTPVSSSGELGSPINITLRPSQSVLKVPNSGVR